ncbi:serine hydrolase domain-containing protein [Costertonia aggregata]|uniref:Beta-lactamase family protein n=1 Tax=Costertonia aggregata TaxID=343403 RepID=A0A7H9AR42_9FLAO|nr:serine hydrolase domain-containing protein [Costertonia aggregata]QLG45900.1 beta-lactamase family protein [Costertonia aggregata]
MRVSLLIILLFFHLFKLTAQTETSLKILDSVTINEWLVENKVPAIAIGTIEKGKLNPVRVLGKIQGDIPASTQTIFDVASLTKTITTLLTLKLVDANSWKLDEPLSHYWIDPDIKNNPLHNKITTRHVLSHRTGFKNWRRMNKDKKLTFDFEPGTKFQYSGEGFEYLRKALEEKFDISFQKLTDSLVFKPNKMNNSQLTWSESIDSLNFAGTHDKYGNEYVYKKSSKANAADNLLTTIGDFSNLGLNIINQQYLDQNTYREMIIQHSSVRDGISFGLGWIIFNDLSNNEYALFNAGSDQGINALIVLLPKSKRGLIVMTNGDNGRALAMKIIGETLGEIGKEILGRF